MASIIRKFTTALVLGLILTGGCVFAQEQELSATLQGQLAFNNGQFDDALAYWTDSAKAGDHHAQVLLGLMYANGWGIVKSITDAAYWFRQAAERNNSDAQFLLGMLFMSNADNTNTVEAIHWLQRAADNGDRMAQAFINKAQQKGWIKTSEPAS